MPDEAITARKRTKKTRKTSGSRDDGTLATYFHDLGRHDLMSADEELAKAAEIAELRRAYWKVLLAYPPFVPAIADLIARELGDDAPAHLLDGIRQSSRQFRDRATREHEERFHQAIAELSEHLCHADAECQIADRIAADVESVDAGRRDGLALEVRFPPRGSKKFHRYAQRTRERSSALRMARNDFIRANLRLVVKMAHRFNAGLLSFADLIQEGNLGLMKAVDRFDHRKGFRFSTYASWWIRHAITRATVNKGRTIRIPAHLYSSYVKLRRVRRELEARLGRPATVPELSEALDMTRSQVDRILKTVRRQSVSLDAPRPGGESGDERTLADILEDPDSDRIHQFLEDAALEGRLRELLQELPPLEVDILRKRFGLDGDEGKTLAEVGNLHDLSRERIRQLQNRALDRLRRGLRSEGVQLA